MKKVILGLSLSFLVLFIGTGYTSQIIPNSGTTNTLDFQDSDGNSMLKIVDGGSAGNVTVSGTITQTGNATLSGALSVTGTSALTGNVTFTADADINGSLLLDVTSVTADTTLTATQSGYIIVESTYAITLTLPAVSGNTGLTYTVKLDSAAVAVFAVTLDGNSSEKIDGATTNAQIDNWYDYVTITTDGDEWFIVAEKEN